MKKTGTAASAWFTEHERFAEILQKAAIFWGCGLFSYKLREKFNARSGRGKGGQRETLKAFSRIRGHDKRKLRKTQPSGASSRGMEAWPDFRHGKKARTGEPRLFCLMTKGFQTSFDRPAGPFSSSPGHIYPLLPWWRRKSSAQIQRYHFPAL